MRLPHTRCMDGHVPAGVRRAPLHMTSIARELSRTWACRRRLAQKRDGVFEFQLSDGPAVWLDPKNGAAIMWLCKLPSTAWTLSGAAGIRRFTYSQPGGSVAADNSATLWRKPHHCPSRRFSLQCPAHDQYFASVDGRDSAQWLTNCSSKSWHHEKDLPERQPIGFAAKCRRWTAPF